MRYRDLLPDRLGGRFIASTSPSPTVGPCPTTSTTTDPLPAHLLPPGLGASSTRTRARRSCSARAIACCSPPGSATVLEASPGLHVVELSCPAEHVTLLDHELTLPTPEVRPERDFGGQRFVHHEATVATWQPAWLPGFGKRETGVAGHRRPRRGQGAQASTLPGITARMPR